MRFLDEGERGRVIYKIKNVISAAHEAGHVVCARMIRKDIGFVILIKSNIPGHAAGAAHIVAENFDEKFIIAGTGGPLQRWYAQHHLRLDKKYWADALIFEMTAYDRRVMQLAQIYGNFTKDRFNALVAITNDIMNTPEVMEAVVHLTPLLLAQEFTLGQDIHDIIDPILGDNPFLLTEKLKEYFHGQIT